MTSTPFLERSVVAAAVRDTVPVAASIAPLALVIGATAARAGVPVPRRHGRGPPSSSPEPRTWPR